jgi:hypothetical protein
VSIPSALTLGIGIGVLLASPLLGVGAVWAAERIQTWNLRRP